MVSVYAYNITQSSKNNNNYDDNDNINNIVLS